MIDLDVDAIVDMSEDEFEALIARCEDGIVYRLMRHGVDQGVIIIGFEQWREMEERDGTC